MVTIPGWLKDAMKQAEEHSAREQLDGRKHLTPIVALVEKGMREDEILCVLRLENYVRLLDEYAKLASGHIYTGIE